MANETLTGNTIPRMMFNRQMFNRPFQMYDENILIKAEMSEFVTGWLQAAVNFSTSHKLFESLTGTIRAESGSRITSNLAESLQGTLYALAGQQIVEAFGESLSGSVNLGANIELTETNINESLDGKVHLGANIYLLFSPAEKLSGASHMGANIYVTPVLYEVLNGYASVVELAEYVTVINEPIPAGAVLVIDAANYTMSIREGEITRDVIHWHSGDWININRGTISLTLSGVAKSYDWEVFYNALYL